jgi:PmbA protein
MSSNPSQYLLDQAEQLVLAAQKAGADASDARVGSSQSQGVEVRMGKVSESERSESHAFVLRVFVGSRIASISANSLDNIDVLAQRAVAMAKVSPENEFEAIANPDLLAQNIYEKINGLDLYDDKVISSGELAKAALEMEAIALDVAGVTNSMGSNASFGSSGVVLVSSNGFSGAYQRSGYSRSISVVAGEGETMQRDYDYDSKIHFEDLNAVSKIAKSAAKRAVEKLNPRTVPSQAVNVIYDKRVSSGLLGHLCGAINGASIARKSSFLKDDMGEKILNESITINDDPHIKRGFNSWGFDGEGVESNPLTMVEKGVLKEWYLDIASANEMGLKTNGRGHRAGGNTSPGSTNVSIAPGDVSIDDMIKQLGTGLLVTEMIGRGVNLITGDYSRGASGFWIENGEIAYPVSEVTLADNLRDMFLKMTPASDFEYRRGMDAPSLMIEGMALAGK